MRVYVAAPFEDAPAVRLIHELLRDRGIEPSSSWAEKADGNEDFARFTIGELAELAASNDDDVLTSHAVLVVARKGAGGEMFAEARLAAIIGMPIVWMGRYTLSAYRPGVTRCETVDECIAVLAARLAGAVRS